MSIIQQDTPSTGNVPGPMALLALECAKQGMPVFPCSPGNKRPLVKGGFKSATTDPEQIQEWWQQSPNAMIGIPTGETTNLLILDVDEKPAKDDKPAVSGRRILSDLEKIHGKLPPTLEVTTPGGGKHLYFKHAEGFKNWANILGDGLDIRTTGGYIVGYGSRNQDGGIYRQGSIHTIATIPDWVLEEIKRLKTEKKNSQKLINNNHPVNVGQAVEALKSLDDTYAAKAFSSAIYALKNTKEGGRNDALNLQAHGLFKLVNAGRLDRDIVAKSLLEAALGTGLGSDAAKATLNSAWNSQPEPNYEGLSQNELDKLSVVQNKPKCFADLQSKFRITKADVKGIKNMKFLYKQSLPEGHLIAIVGEPGCGKTTIMEFICARIKGDITYINDDIPKSSMPEAKLRADTGGYALVIPDQRIGESIESFMEMLYKFANSGEDLTGKVFIIDTLKKITKVNNKGDAVDTYKKLRLLTSRGATVICLGHCLKYRDDEGFPVYEGTADLQADFDELVLLHANTGDYGMVTTSLYWREQGWGPGKARAIVHPLSWTIDTENNRKVTELTEWVDTVVLGKENRQTLKSADVIIDIYKLLDKTGEMNKGDIVKNLKSSNGHGSRIVNRVLDTQTGKFWSVQTGNHNAKLFTAIAGANIPAPSV